MGGLMRVLGGRAVQAVLVALLVGTACFLMVRLLPGDMAYRIAASRYGYDLVDSAAAEAVRQELGLDRPWLVQLGAWFADLSRFDLGTSLASGEEVADALRIQLGHTLLLSVAALFFSLLLGPPLGVLAGLRSGGWLDGVLLALSAALRAVPAFVLGIGLMLWLAVEWEWLPVAGVGGWREVILPALTLALGLAAASCRVTRDAVAAVAASPFFGFARMKGLGDTAAFRRHGLRNAAIPVVAYLGLQLVVLIEGVVVVESLFAWPGIGHALVHAVLGRDIPMVQGTALVMGLLFVVLNALTDLACWLLDPRRRTA
ncbi:ABC transporter permease subunit [Pseudoroseomonas wenyumeiae]|uniref:ABC transporter permease n=1 Tax=Teichococcus wenyumeiae TaxID=2478470 RepID=A0A3A9J3W3_9PROT|nr:ABC transporter permease [Pseudoroseomonas wenyumeiae]RKK01887.1 ABC transporter permease [Pseudoroseomonas wenyumeiae]RMI15290.1 ABC transporter permease subunit [Pseudoroseomonas wenyumeiae]